MSNNEEKGVALNFLAGVGIGAIIGAGIALLFAPKSGTETRDDIKNAMHELSKSTEDLRNKSAEIVESAKARVQETINRRRIGEESEEA
ncbi:MAG: YtxH domain-containing protein [Armatimonadota bacterium]